MLRVLTPFAGLLGGVHVQIQLEIWIDVPVFASAIFQWIELVAIGFVSLRWLPLFVLLTVGFVSSIWLVVFVLLLPFENVLMPWTQELWIDDLNVGHEVVLIVPSVEALL